MNWKIWTWPAQMRQLAVDAQNANAEKEAAEKLFSKYSELYVKGERNLTLARRALSRYRKAEGMDDVQIAAAFEALLDNKGFEAILALLAEAEMAAVDRMTEDGTSFADMKKAGGAVDALTNLHARLIELEEQARRTVQRRAGKAA